MIFSNKLLDSRVYRPHPRMIPKPFSFKMMSGMMSLKIMTTDKLLPILMGQRLSRYMRLKRMMMILHPLRAILKILMTVSVKSYNSPMVNLNLKQPIVLKSMMMSWQHGNKLAVI